MRINVILNYDLGEEDKSDDYTFDNIEGDWIAERIGQESANEIISSLDEFDGKEATVQLIDEDNKVVKEKKVLITE